MRDSFLVHIAISAIIFAILASGFRFYVRLKGTLDFSYLAIVIFASYAAALCNIHRDIGILGSIGIAFSLSLLFTFFVLYLSSRLDDVYFTIWTLALYILAYQLAFNLEWITGGALWLSGMNRHIIGDVFAPWLWPYLAFSAFAGIIIFAGLFYFKKTYLYRILQGWVLDADYAYTPNTKKTITFSDLSKLVSYYEVKFVNTDENGKEFTLTIPKAYSTENLTLNFVSDDAVDETMKIPIKLKAFPDDSNIMLVIDDEQSVV